MSIQARALALVCAAFVAVSCSSSALATAITQSATLPLTPTDFGQSNDKVAPLVFQKFDTEGGTRKLDSVTLAFHAMIKNEFGLRFITPATMTDTVASADPKAPGPAITMYQPDGVHTLLKVQATDPATLTRSVTYGFKPGERLPQSFGSDQSPSSPFYLAPAVSQASNTLKLTSPADLALFTGKGDLRLPVSASAFSQFTTSSGNGYGSVSTQATADATITYEWHENVPAPQTVPEPTAVILWGLGGVALLAVKRARRV